MDAEPAIVDRAELDALFGALRRARLHRHRAHGALAVARLRRAAQRRRPARPAGSTCRRAGPSACSAATDEALFAHTVGHDSLKRFLFPPQLAIWRARRGDDGTLEVERPRPPPRYAFVGVRSCDLHAVAIQDRVFLGDRYVDADYEAPPARRVLRRGQLRARRRHLLLRRRWTRARASRGGFDLALTELLDERRPPLRRRGRQRPRRRGARRARPRAPPARTRPRAPRRGRRARARLDGPDARRRPTSATCCTANAEHPRWDEVADRCLSCGNCTMVCPTCFCSTVEDTTDLAGARDRAHAAVGLVLHARALLRARRQRAPTTGRSRYRQWMTHKLATWIDQFGTLGLRRLRALHHLVPGRDRHHRGGGGDPRHRPARGRRCGRLRSCWARSPALQALAPEHRETIAGCARNRVFEPGERIMREGDPADAFYVIREGAVALETAVPGARAGRWSRRSHDGDLLGWSWLVPPYRNGVRRPLARDDPRDRARRRLPARQVRRRPGAGLRPAQAPGGRVRRAPAGHAAAAARPLREARRWLSCRTAFRVADKRRETADTWTLRLEPRGRDGARRLRPGPVRDALRVRRRRGADLGQQHRTATASSCTPSAPSAR